MSHYRVIALFRLIYDFKPRHHRSKIRKQRKRNTICTHIFLTCRKHQPEFCRSQLQYSPLGLKETSKLLNLITTAFSHWTECPWEGTATKGTFGGSTQRPFHTTQSSPATVPVGVRLPTSFYANTNFAGDSKVVPLSCFSQFYLTAEANKSIEIST